MQMTCIQYEIEQEVQVKCESRISVDDINVYLYKIHIEDVIKRKSLKIMKTFYGNLSLITRQLKNVGLFDEHTRFTELF